MAVGERSTVSKILTYQIVVVAFAVAFFAIAGGQQKAWSCVLGGLAAFIPNLYFGWQLRRSADKAAKRIVNAFYAGEFGKWVLTIVLFVVSFKFFNIEIFSLLTGYVAAISIFWFALLMR
jgi:ATP synthase protein I